MRKWIGLALVLGVAQTHPPNDNPCNAITLTPQQGCAYYSGNLQGATPTSNVPPPTCGFSLSINDVWFRFITPNSGRVVIQVSSSFDLAMAIYTNPFGCNSPVTFAQLECDDDDGPGLNPAICRVHSNLDGCPGVNSEVQCQFSEMLYGGQEIWIRLWRKGFGVGSVPYQICVTLRAGLIFPFPFTTADRPIIGFL